MYLQADRSWAPPPDGAGSHPPRTHRVLSHGAVTEEPRSVQTKISGSENQVAQRLGTACIAFIGTSVG